MTLACIDCGAEREIGVHYYPSKRCKTCANTFKNERYRVVRLKGRQIDSIKHVKAIIAQVRYLLPLLGDTSSRKALTSLEVQVEQIAHSLIEAQFADVAA